MDLSLRFLCRTFSQWIRIYIRIRIYVYIYIYKRYYDCCSEWCSTGGWSDVRAVRSKRSLFGCRAFINRRTKCNECVKTGISYSIRLSPAVLLTKKEKKNEWKTKTPWMLQRAFSLANKWLSQKLHVFYIFFLFFLSCIYPHYQFPHMTSN